MFSSAFIFTFTVVMIAPRDCGSEDMPFAAADVGRNSDDVINQVCCRCSPFGEFRQEHAIATGFSVSVRI